MNSMNESTQSVRIFDTPEVQQFLRVIAGMDNTEGSDRAKAILHRILSDLFKTIDDFDITPDEYWRAIAVLNALGAGTQFGLLSPGLGFDHYLDMRMDAADEAAQRAGGTPRTIEGPLYVAGAPEVHGVGRMDDDPDPDGETMWLTGQVKNVDGVPLSGAKVEIWHANSKGGYSFFDPTQSDYNLRRTIITDAEGRYAVRSTIPSGYGVPPGSATDQVLKALGRHGERPAHIHYFVSAAGYQHLTTQINLAGDPYTYDDFAYATREELVVDGKRIEDATEIDQRGLDGPFTEVVFDVELTVVDDPLLQVRHARPRAKESNEAASQQAGSAKV
uniref:catechol 1,2-dioxygenase n=1 Tax=Halomonas sp. TaxID=1486246 RepID=UPI0026300D4D|nr:catechol 1,2-dioxygenase [Halomonas sp.]